MKQFWILAGGNGSGKSRFFETRLKPTQIKFINADEIGLKQFTKNRKTDAFKATIEAQHQVNETLEKGQSLCYETVFSHKKKIDIIAKAKGLGYQINLIFIHLDSSELNEARVLQRVKLNGHDVPSDRIGPRIVAGLANMKVAIKLADSTLLLDNSSTENPYAEVALIEKGIVHTMVSPLPKWADEIIEGL